MSVKMYKEGLKLLEGTFPQAVYDFMDSIKPATSVMQYVDVNGQNMLLIGFLTGTGNYGACLVITDGYPLRKCKKYGGSWSYETYTAQ